MEELLGLPINAAAHGPQIDGMIAEVHWMMLALLVGWSFFFLYTLYRFRSGKHQKADYQGAKNKTALYLPIGVGIFEGFLLVAFAFPLWTDRIATFPSEEESTVVRVVAEQFAWNFHYPGRDGVFGLTDRSLVSPTNPVGLDRNDPYAKDDIVSINQFNMPVNKPVLVYLSSKDVIHSFSLPHFRVKQDAVPGEMIKTSFTPIMTTADMKVLLTKPFSIENGAFPPELRVLVAVKDYEDADGNIIAYQDYAFDEEIIKALNAAGINEVQAGPENPTEVACAQLCGLGHYRMRGFMNVQTDEEYEEWFQEQESYLSYAEEESDSADDE